MAIARSGHACVPLRAHAKPWAWHPILILLAGCLLTGCGEQSGPIAQEQTNLSWLGNMYGRYIGAHQGQPPQSVDEFRKFVSERTDSAELQRLRASDVNELFRSPRDGKPFELVVYRKLPAPAGGEPQPVVLYEAAGKNGERAVAFLGGGTQVVNDSELQTMLPAGARSR